MEMRAQATRLGYCSTYYIAKTGTCVATFSLRMMVLKKNGQEYNKLHRIPQDDA